jgi:hypothetical protein
MPASRQVIPPQTSKKARRAYLKANKQFEFTSTQARASKRRLELDKRAKALQAKEQRKRDNKRKREEKEASEREARKKRIESGRAPIETFWGKVRASQPRLNTFFSKPEAADHEAKDYSASEGESNLVYDYRLEKEVGCDTVEQAGQDLAAETEGLENFFSSPACKTPTDMAQALVSNAVEAPAQSRDGELVADDQNTDSAAPRQPEQPGQALLDAQLSLSQGIFDFDIAEDDDAEWMPVEIEDIKDTNDVQSNSMKNRLLATPSKRKAEISDMDFASPAKSARSALSEMSPSKVNIRAQEKPDIFSVAPPASKLPSPQSAKQAGNQSADDILAMIATQDLEDEEFATDKENEDPSRSVSMKRSENEDHAKETATSSSSSKHDPPGSANPVKELLAQRQSYNENMFDDDDFGAFESGQEDEEDDFDNDLDDETLAALAANSPSKHKSPASLPQTSAITANMKPWKLHFRDIPTASVYSQQLAQDATIGRVEFMAPPQSISTKPRAQGSGYQPQYRQPLATQSNSFAFNDVQDDDLTAFAEELDAGDLASVPRVGTKSKSSRKMPWNPPLEFPTSQGLDEPLSQDEDPPYH